MSPVFSTRAELERIADILCRYMRLPVAGDSVPGAFLESVLAHVRGGQVLPTYDYVDVINRDRRIGWSIKSTKASTPMTWKRAKIADKVRLIEESRKSAEGMQALGDAIIAYCNDHAIASMRDYGLTAIGYARLIVFPDDTARYFEREIASEAKPLLFDPAEFQWRWSTPKATTKKEQLPALHGVHAPTGKKWWAWHGLGENQLHFSGEEAWWPADDDVHAIQFRLPSAGAKLSFDALLELIAPEQTPAGARDR